MLGLKRALHMAALVIVGEYMLLNVINISLFQQTPIMNYHVVPAQLINIAVSKKPILGVAQAYTTMKKNIDFDSAMLKHHPVKVKGQRPDFRAYNLQDKEGAQVGLRIKF